jgi:hypothetical protein
MAKTVGASSSSSFCLHPEYDMSKVDVVMQREGCTVESLNNAARSEEYNDDSTEDGDTNPTTWILAVNKVSYRPAQKAMSLS